LAQRICPLEDTFLTRSSAPWGLNVIRKKAWLFCRTNSSVRLCWEHEKPKIPQGTGSPRDGRALLRTDPPGGEEEPRQLHGCLAHKKTHSPKTPCLGAYGGPRGLAISYERGIPVRPPRRGWARASNAKPMTPTYVESKPIAATSCRSVRFLELPT
jgi:hypothetical protein